MIIHDMTEAQPLRTIENYGNAKTSHVVPSSSRLAYIHHKSTTIYDDEYVLGVELGTFIT